MIENPCYKCEKRSAECHISCERYAEWKAEKEADNKRRNEYNAQHNMFNYKSVAIRRYMQRKSTWSKDPRYKRK